MIQLECEGSRSKEFVQEERGEVVRRLQNDQQDDFIGPVGIT